MNDILYVIYDEVGETCTPILVKNEKHAKRTFRQFIMNSKITIDDSYTLYKIGQVITKEIELYSAITSLEELFKESENENEGE